MIVQASSYAFVLIQIFILSVAANSCYFPEGDVGANDLACFPLQEFSFCCGPGYACLENKLCMNTPEASDGLSPGSLIRGSCTDPTYDSSACPPFCNNAGADEQGGSFVTHCTNDTYCCGGDDCDCNSGQNVITILGSLAIVTIIPNSAATTTVTDPTIEATTSFTVATSSAVTTATLSATPTSNPSQLLSSTGSNTMLPPAATQSSSVSGASDSNNSIKIGLGVGIPLGAIAIGIIVYLAWLCGRRRHKPVVDSNAGMPLNDDNGLHRVPEAGKWNMASSKPMPSERYELVGGGENDVVPELPAFSR